MATALTDHELLGKLVSFDSTSCNSNMPIADFICNYMDLPNVVIVRNESDREDKTNLIIKVGPDSPHGSPHDGLVLSGHMDVVPAVEPEWRSDPFAMEEADDVLIGRGTCDMKGFLALALNEARACADEPLNRPLVLVLTFDEELGLLGAQHLVNTWDNQFPLPNNGIVGEPTSLKVVRMHKGHLKLLVTLRGQSAHSAYPKLGRSAIEPAGKAIMLLSELRQQLESEGGPNAEFFPEAPFAGLNIGTIIGGSAVNIVPDRCQIDFGVRLLPGMKTDDFLKRLRGVLEGGDIGEYELEVTAEGPAMVASEDAKIYTSLCELINQDEALAVSYGTDGGVLQNLGIECVLFGPGWIEVAHKPNECISKKELAIAKKVVSQSVYQFCVDS